MAEVKVALSFKICPVCHGVGALPRERPSPYSSDDAWRRTGQPHLLPMTCGACDGARLFTYCEPVR